MFSLLTMLEADIAYSHTSTYISITYERNKCIKNNINLSHYRKLNKMFGTCIILCYINNNMMYCFDNYAPMAYI